MTGYVDGSADDQSIYDGDRRKGRKDRKTADEVARQMFWERESDYSGSPAAMAKLRARRGSQG